MTGTHIDTDSLTGAGGELARVADGISAGLNRLRTALDGQDDAWGDDEVGRPFGQEYAAVLRRALTAIASYETQVRHAGESLSALAALFTDAENVNAERIRRLRVPHRPVTD